MSRGLFIAATGTDVGKTFVTALILKKLREAGLRAGYYKAALSGAERSEGGLVPGDADYVKRTAGLDTPLGEMVSYVYEAPVSPHLAAKTEGNPVSMERVVLDYRRACERFDYVVVEGSGGIVCPLRRDGGERIMLTDVIRTLGLTVLIVSASSLGAINGAVLTSSYAGSLGIPVKGFVLNRFWAGDPVHEDNRRTIEELTGCPVLACVGERSTDIGIDPATLAALFA